MPSMTLSEASKATGKGRTTLWRAIKSGRLSASRGESGEHLIDPAELARAFPPEPSKDSPLEHHGRGGGEAWKAAMEAKDALIAELRERVGDLTRERDKWIEQAEAIRLLTAPPIEKKRRWWRRGG